MPTKVEAMKRHATDRQHHEDHAWEYRLSLQGKKGSVTDFKLVKDTIISVVYIECLAAVWDSGWAAKQETQVRFLSQKDPLEEGMATHSSILAWRIPWTEGAWLSTKIQRGGHHLETALSSVLFQPCITSLVWIYVNHVWKKFWNNTQDKRHKMIQKDKE